MPEADILACCHTSKRKTGAMTLCFSPSGDSEPCQHFIHGERRKRVQGGSIGGGLQGEVIFHMGK